ncbi:MAG TPA: hypothetical protein VN736_10795 [Candidatus Limnocylindrales bacterium]|nr:hypothetical protein [Candidatus Limnocylindrales bacterium]
MNEDKRLDWIPVVSLGLAVAVALLLYFNGGDPMQHLKVLAAYVALILVFFFGLMILVAMVRGRIDLSKLISEQDGTASISRFQLLIFTLVIALSMIFMLASTSSFPELPNQALILLGISASTYGVSKGIQKSAEMAQSQGSKDKPEDKADAKGA